MTNLRAAVVLLLALPCWAASAAPAQTPTFNGQIGALVYGRCAGCHHPGGDAPFSLTSYDEVRQRGRQIAEVVRRNLMPPWKPDRTSARFIGERRLSAAEKRTIASWVAAGMPEGRSAPAPAPPVFAGGWRTGTPDVVVTLPPYQLAADGADSFRNVVVAVPGTGTRYVRAFEFRPGNPAVHHANIFVDRTTASRRLDDADPEAGYEGVILNSAEFPDGHFLGWTPGQAALPAAAELSWRIDGGSDFVVQLHMQPTGRVETIAPQLGLYLTDEPPPSTPTMIRLGRQNLDIPANADAHVVRDSVTLPVDVRLLALQPHAHYRAHQVRAVAQRPDGTIESLIAIPDWDFRWQDQYRLADPVWLPAGTTLVAEYTFDNSSTNARNPDRPPRRVEWGWRTTDEMGDVWFQVATRSDADRRQLAALVRRKMAVEETVGSEQLIARNPDHVALRNDAGRLYLELQQPQDALRHFTEVTRITPSSAPAWFNQAVAADALGRRRQAEEWYRRATTLDPAYVPARMAVAAIDAAAGRFAAALSGYEQVLSVNPAQGDAHCQRARVLTVTGRFEAAASAFRDGLRAAPAIPSCLVSFAWLLGAHADERIRRPQEAVEVATRAVTLAGRDDAAALDALGIAYAAAGRFDDAVRASEEAVAVATSRSASVPLADLRARLRLYRDRKTFVVPN